MPAHATLVISVYPWGPAPRRSLGFRLAPSGPHRAKFLRAEQAVIARRAYELIHHVVDEDGCGWRSTGTRLPAVRPKLMLTHPGRLVPRVVIGRFAPGLAPWTGLSRLSDPGAFMPVMRLPLRAANVHVPVVFSGLHLPLMDQVPALRAARNPHLLLEVHGPVPPHRPCLLLSIVLLQDVLPLFILRPPGIRPVAETIELPLLLGRSGGRLRGVEGGRTGEGRRL